MLYLTVRGLVIMAYKKKPEAGSAKIIKKAAAEVSGSVTLTFVSGTFITAETNPHL